MEDFPTVSFFFSKSRCIHHFYYQLTHTTLKNLELLKHSKISKTAPTSIMDKTPTHALLLNTILV